MGTLYVQLYVVLTLDTFIKNITPEFLKNEYTYQFTDDDMYFKRLFTHISKTTEKSMR